MYMYVNVYIYTYIDGRKTVWNFLRHRAFQPCTGTKCLSRVSACLFKVSFLGFFSRSLFEVYRPLLTYASVPSTGRGISTARRNDTFVASQGVSSVGLFPWSLFEVYRPLLTYASVPSTGRGVSTARKNDTFVASQGVSSLGLFPWSLF